MTETTLTKLAERYPFDHKELEVLTRCHEGLLNSNENFLLNLAKASPYTHYFLPGDELQDRVLWIEDHILPPGFASSIRAAIAIDPFVDYANQGAGKQLERFIEGVADTGRRGTREALRVLLRICPSSSEEPLVTKDILDLIIRLVVADEALVSPTLDKERIVKKLNALQPLVETMSNNASEYLSRHESHQATFLRWAENRFPLITSPLSTFVHHLLFHEHGYPSNRVSLQLPELDQASLIFPEDNDRSPSLYALAFMSNDLGGKWHRLYSTEVDGRSFNRMEWSVLGYAGPTCLVVKTTNGETLGAYTGVTWRESSHFYGNLDCFLMELKPCLRVHRPVEAGGARGEHHFMFLHTSHTPMTHGDSNESPLNHPVPCGLGFGGSMSKPRLFIPESFEHCSADFLDKTFESGNLLSTSAMERFEVEHLEIWGVGGTSVIEAALQARAAHREIQHKNVEQARNVRDRHVFVNDLRSGLIPNSIYAHTKDTRGRQEFRVDEKHGGYVVDK